MSVDVTLYQLLELLEVLDKLSELTKYEEPRVEEPSPCRLRLPGALEGDFIELAAMDLGTGDFSTWNSYKAGGPADRSSCVWPRGPLRSGFTVLATGRAMGSEAVKGRLPNSVFGRRRGAGALALETRALAGAMVKRFEGG